MTNLHGDDPHPAFVGLPTYLHLPFARDAAELRSSDADIAILGAPVDMGVVYRPGTRFGPRAIRDASYFTASRTLYHLGLDIDPLEFLKVADELGLMKDLD